MNLSSMCAKTRTLCVLSLSLLCTTLVVAGGAQSMNLSNASTQGTASTNMILSLDASAPVEGYVSAVEFDGSQCAVSDISQGSATSSANAELFISEIFANGFTVGCVVDAAAPSMATRLLQVQASPSRPLKSHQQHWSQQTPMLHFRSVMEP
ncbi:MAG: hypothetical protein GWP38_02165 [Planctomycetia bacterium]|nr:hypothetical protein [Planctomycetia bacterium]